MQCQDFEILWSDHSQPPFPYLSRQEGTQPQGFQDHFEDKSTPSCAWCSCTGHWSHRRWENCKGQHTSHLGNSPLPCNPCLFYSLAGICHPGIFLPHPCNHCCSCTLAHLMGIRTSKCNEIRPTPLHREGWLSHKLSKFWQCQDWLNQACCEPSRG